MNATSMTMNGNSSQLAAAGDIELVHASRNGDMSAFQQLVERYDRRLFRIAQHITHNREDSQDAVQEAFLKAFEHLGQFREESKFSTWLIRITLNQSLMKVRKRRAIREVSLDEDFQGNEGKLPPEVADWAPNPEELYTRSELRDILNKTMKKLSPSLRAVFVLRDIEGLSTREAAEALDLTTVAIKARLWRARLRLREGLSKYFSRHEHSAPIDLISKALGIPLSREGACL